MIIIDASFKCFLAVLVLALTATAAQAAVNIDMVPVFNTGNTADTTGYGAVDYAYSIGTYEVTAGQYTAFLNAVAATDTYGLYNPLMWSSTYGCKIEHTLVGKSYTYSVADEYTNRPVNFVSWGDAARFANWLHNGQPTGAQGLATTEDGAYYLNGATTDAELLAITRNANTMFFIPTEDEWYKAAYHKNDGATSNYFEYQTSSDFIDMSMANYGMWQNVGRTTDVGSYASPSPYGTFDMGGNVWEWNEAIRSSRRVARGGSFISDDDDLHASHRNRLYPTYEYSGLGFRVASNEVIPEPLSVLVWCGLAAAGFFCWRRRR